MFLPANTGMIGYGAYGATPPSHPGRLQTDPSSARGRTTGEDLVPLSVPLLREILRNYQGWKSLYEAREAPDTLTDGGYSITLWDIEYLIDNLGSLPPRQRQAIQFCLIENMRETDAAVRMGVSPTNPVGMYANSGLTKLIVMIRAGQLPRFQESDDEREAG